jgi:hypothetical protein
MRTDAEVAALKLIEPKRPWWKPTFVMIAVLALTIGLAVEFAQLQIALGGLAVAVANTAALANENRRLAGVAAETATHGCRVTAALVDWVRGIGPLEATVTGNTAYHQARLRKFNELQARLYAEDGIPCGDAAPAFMVFPFPITRS